MSPLCVHCQCQGHDENCTRKNDKTSLEENLSLQMMALQKTEDPWKNITDDGIAKCIAILLQESSQQNFTCTKNLDDHCTTTNCDCSNEHTGQFQKTAKPKQQSIGGNYHSCMTMNQIHQNGVHENAMLNPQCGAKHIQDENCNSKKVTNHL